MEIRLNKIAEMVGGVLHGDGSLVCRGANPPGQAADDEITMLVQPNHSAEESCIGGVAIITVTFSNVGEIEATATFQGEFVREGQRLDVIESLPKTIPPGASGTTEIYVDIAESGVYTVVGRAAYAESTSEPRDVSFRVGPRPLSFATRWGWWIMGIGSGVVISLIVVITLIRRRRIETYLPKRRSGPPWAR